MVSGEGDEMKHGKRSRFGEAAAAEAAGAAGATQPGMKSNGDDKREPIM